MLNKIIKTLSVVIIGILVFSITFMGILYIESLNEKINIIGNCLEELNQTNELQNNLIYFLMDKNIEIDNTKVANNILKSSVIVYGKDGMGSGTVIGKTSDSMYILTCYHVVADIIEENNEKLQAFIGYSKYKMEGNKYVSKGQILYTADIIKASEEKDLAILKINYSDDNLQIATISFIEPIKGDIIYTAGNPLGIERTVSKGIIANIFDEYYMTDGTITYGNSGGGLYNVRGELIGVPACVPGYNALFSIIPESGLGMSINLKTVKEFIEGMI